jgi:alkylglycerol monooxygenase
MHPKLAWLSGCRKLGHLPAFFSIIVRGESSGPGTLPAFIEDMMVPLSLLFFLLLIAVEVYAGRKYGVKVYRFRDTTSHLAIGLGQQVTNFAVMGMLAGAYAAIQSHFGWITFNESAKWQWAVVILTADLTYYFAHRLGHRVNLFIIPHSVHHQAKDYNYASALRLPWMNRVIMFVFYIPLALLGIPPKMMLSAFLANLLVGTLAHNGVLRRKLGPIDSIFVTPRTHFVHHGTEGKYLDKNFGGVFIVWDRLFGTFQDLDEEVPVVLPGANSPDFFDPFEANLDYIRKLHFGLLHRKSLFTKAKLLFETPEKLEADLERFGYANSRMPRAPEFARSGDRVRVVLAFIATSVVSITLLQKGPTLSIALQLVLAAVVFAGSAYIGRLLRRVPTAEESVRAESRAA